MRSINATAARRDLYNLVAAVNEGSAPVAIVNAKGKGAVLVGEDDWESIQETLHLMSIPGYVESVREALEEGVEAAVPADDQDW